MAASKHTKEKKIKKQGKGKKRARTCIVDFKGGIFGDFKG